MSCFLPSIKIATVHVVCVQFLRIQSHACVATGYCRRGQRKRNLVYRMGLHRVFVAYALQFAYGLKVHSALKTFAAKLTAKPYADAGWESRATDGHLDSLARAAFLRMQAKYSEGNDALLTEAKRRFNIYVADPSNVKVLPSEIILPVFKLILRESDSAQEYEMLMNLYSR